MLTILRGVLNAPDFCYRNPLLPDCARIWIESVLVKTGKCPLELLIVDVTSYLGPFLKYGDSSKLLSFSVSTEPVRTAG